MIAVISPSKTLDFDKKPDIGISSKPLLISESEKIMQVLRKKSVKKLIDLQGISKNLAELNYMRNQNWNVEHPKNITSAAITAFKGDVYLGLDASTFKEDDYLFANEHLRVLSGLYGILKPADQIMPYRLEMGTKLSTTRGKDIYAFWKNRITECVNEELGIQDSKFLLNLASDEYFKVLSPKKIKAPILQPIFMDKKNGKYKVISFFAKKARGMMSRFIIKNRLDNPNDIKAFDSEGYLYNSQKSTEDKWLFLRDNE